MRQPTNPLYETNAQLQNSTICLLLSNTFQHFFFDLLPHLAFVVPLSKQLKQPKEPLVFWSHFDDLLNVGIHDTATAHLDLYSFMLQRLPCKHFYLELKACNGRSSTTTTNVVSIKSRSKHVFEEV